MSSLFLNPWLLTGLLALAVPIIVHLARREQDEDRPFPSLMFIKKLKTEDRRRRTLRDRALLLARLLALSLLVLAFVRPFLSNDDGQTTTTGNLSQTVLLVDVSASMSLPGQRKEASEQLLKAIDALAENAAAAIVAFDSDARQVHEMSEDHTSLRQSARDLYSAPGVAATNYAPAFRYANELLKEDPKRSSRVVLISDLQDTGFDDSQVSLLENVELIVVPVQNPLSANLMISDIKADAEQLKINVINTGEKPTNTTSLQLSVDNVEQVLELESLEPGENSSLSVPFTIKSSEAVAVHVTPGSTALEQDIGMPADLNHSAVFRDGRTINTLIVTDAEFRRDSDAGKRSYLAHAMQLAEHTNVLEIHGRELDTDSFTNFDVIIFDDGVLPQAKVADALVEAIEAGVGVLFVSDQRLHDGASRQLVDYLPGQANTESAPESESASLSDSGVYRVDRFLDYHPVTATLGQSLEGDGALSAVKFLNYQAIRPGDSDRVLAELDNGDPLMIEKVTDKGRVILVSASLDARSSNLATAPGFVRLSHRVLDYLADRATVTESYQRASVVDLARHAGAFAGGGAWRTGLAEVGAVIETPSGQQLRLEPGQTFYQPMETGIHQARLSSANAGTIAIAVNPDPRESNIQRIDDNLFIDRIAYRAWPEVDSATNSKREATESGQLWRWLLAIAALLLIYETVIANRLTARRNSRTEAIAKP